MKNMTTVNDAIAEFILYCRYERKLSTKTQKFYSIDLKQFLVFLTKKDNHHKIKDIDKTILRSYIHSISDFKPKTIKRKIATLKAFFNFMEFEDKILVNPFRKIRLQIKEPKQLPTVMTIGEVWEIFQVAFGETNSKKDGSKYAIFESIRNLAVIELLFATGVRVSELSNLKGENIDLQDGHIKVIGKGNRERLIQVCNIETLSILKEYSVYANDYRGEGNSVFFVNRYGKRLSEQSIRQIVKNLVSLTNLSKRITPHIFRHSVATLLLEEGVDIKNIQEILGHSSIMTTQIYTHVNKANQKTILTLKHPRKNFSYQ